MSAVVSKKKRERQPASQAPAHHSGEGRNPVPLISALERKGSGDTKLPPGWKLTTLGAEFRWGSGGTPKSSNPAFYDGGIPWAIIGDLNDGPVDSTARTISEAGLRNSSAKLVEPGSVLVAMYGSIGKLGIASVPLATNQAIAFTKPECCSAKFLFWYLYFARSQLIKLGKGGTQSNISQTVLKSFPFVLPPAEEQEHIVAEIEKQFTRLDAGVAALRRVQANLKRYRAAVLKAACEGRLVPTEAELARAEGRTYETGEQLLARILADRRKNWHGRGKYKEPTAPDTTNLPPLPEGWAWATFEQIAERVTVGYVGPMKHEYKADGVPFLRGQNVRENRFDPEGLLYVSSKFHHQLAKSALHPGDLAVVRSGAVGVTCVIPESLPEANCSDLVLIQHPQGFVPRYGAYYMNSLAKRHVIAGKVGVALTHFNTKSVATIPVPLPPIAEQERIVADVERRLSVVEELDAAATANLQRAARLRQAILQRAFVGCGT